MTQYMVVTPRTLSMCLAQLRIVEQLMLDTSLTQEDDSLEFIINFEAPLFEENIDDFMKFPTQPSPMTIPEQQRIKHHVPYTLDKGKPPTLHHRGREYAMRMYGRDNRN